jgi:hypothetical protein
MLIAALVAIVISGSSQQAQPQPEPRPEPTVGETRQAERERLICRRQHVVGSNRPQRVCLTRAEWDEIREDAVEGLERYNRGDANPNMTGSDG